MGRYYFRSARTAAWVVTGLLAVMASFYALPAPIEPVSLAYHRVWQFFQLAFGATLVLPAAQALRAGLVSLPGRLQPATEKAPVDGWAAQIWGPLMLENLAYGAWLLIALAFVWRYQARLPGPEPWQGAHPPYAGPDSGQLGLLGRLYLSALVLTVAGAYANLLGCGLFVLPIWGLLGYSLPTELAGLVGLVVLRILAMGPVPEPKTPGEPRRVRVNLLGLVMVGAMLAVLAAILVPNFVRARARGRLTACKSNLKNIGTALEMYSTDYEGRYPKSPGLLTPKYLKTIPTCPTVGWVTYQFQMASSPDLYTVVCAGHQHGGSGVTAPNYPQYTSITGLIERP